MADPNDLGLPSLKKLQSAEQMELLDVVDSLRACGLSEIVALPQLVVCGDQSSGKSSVLEAISGVPFPKQDTLCTRFATEVILRRAPKDEINVSIVPAEDRALLDKDRLRRFHRELKTKDDFGDLFKVAQDEMGLSSSGKSFSNDILRVEFCGPSQPQLTLVDLPGLIHSETRSQPTGDVELVHKLVSRYLENPRSIILAVVSAKNDIGNQIILRNARRVDPQGLRTLGIITKPDVLARGSKSEKAFVDLARNEDVKFSLGWHVVKNIDSAITQNPPGDRDQQETLFFQNSGFNRLPPHTIGITFLRARLSKVLFGQIQRELPRLVKDIQIQISATRLAQDKLGPSRSKPEQQREFLISLSQTFQTICRDAVRGDYDHEFFQADVDPERRLCATVMNMHFEFASNMRKDGASWLVDDLSANGDKYRSREEAIREACKLLKRSRGRELPGLPNSRLVGELFRQYSRPWEGLAREHIEKVWVTTYRFLELLLRYLTDEEVCENISRFWLNPAMVEKLNLANSKLDDLLEVHKDFPMTTNSHFATKSRASRLDAMKEDLSTKANLDMDMVAAEEAFDNMNAYYEIAMNLFTDNVPTLAVQAPIIRGAPNIFCPTAVFSMDPEIVHKIAGESEEKTVEREAIQARLATLEKGALICKQYATRPQHILKSSSDDIETLESPLSGFKTPKISRMNTPTKSPSTPSRFPESIPATGNIPNPFKHLSVPSQTATSGLDSSSPSGSSTQKDRTPSPKPENTKPSPAVFNWPAQPSGTASTKLPINLFGTPSSAISLATPAPKSSSEANVDTKPPSGGLFGSKPSITAGTSLFANTATKSVFADSATTQPPFTWGLSKTATASNSPVPAREGTLRTTSGKTSTESSGLFAGITPAKNDNSLNKVPDQQ